MTPQNRIPELDLLRGFCILVMIAVHAIYDLRELYALFPAYPPLFSLLKEQGGAVFFLISGISATLGLIAAPLVFILILAAFLSNFAEYEIVKDAFAGIRACVVVLIFSATVKLWKKSVKDLFSLLIFLGVLAAALFTEISSVLFVLAAALAGLLLALLRGKEAGKK